MLKNLFYKQFHNNLQKIKMIYMIYYRKWKEINVKIYIFINNYIKNYNKFNNNKYFNKI